MNKTTDVQASSVRYEGEEFLDKVHPSFRALVEAWKVSPMNFPIRIREGLRSGPEWEAKQARYFANGWSKARTLAETPHGRGAAIDWCPAEWTEAHERMAWPDIPEEIKLKFYKLGLFAENDGFEAGMRWRSNAFPYGDQLHIQLKAWKTLPFPPQEFA